jgi:hypothetical protein
VMSTGTGFPLSANVYSRLSSAARLVSMCYRWPANMR